MSDTENADNVEAAELVPVATGEQPVDGESESKPPDRVQVDALAFAEKMYPMVSSMALDPLCMMVGSTFNSATPIKSVPCAFIVIRQNGQEVAKLVEKHPLKVILYTVAKVFPSITKLGDSDRIEKLVSILFALQATAVLYQAIVAGIPSAPLENQEPVADKPVETPTDKPTKKRKAKVVN